LIELNEETHNGHQPRVGRFEYFALTALLQHLANEWDGDNESVAIIALNQQFLVWK